MGEGERGRHLRGMVRIYKGTGKKGEAGVCDAKDRRFCFDEYLQFYFLVRANKIDLLSPTACSAAAICCCCCLDMLL